MKFIVADSGGSGTSLAFYSSDDDVRYIETMALHPKFLLKWGDEEINKLRKSLPEDLSAPLYFYGAGCSQPGVAFDVKTQLQKIGFENITVFPDTLGACRACCGNESGLVAILGTGSVLLDYSGKEVTTITGGLGSLVGDEGSGFYFGRLLIKYLFGNRIEPDVAEEVYKVLGNQSLIRAQLAGGESIQFISTIGSKVQGLPLDHVHIGNLTAFFDSHLNSEERFTLNFVGSYAWAQRENLRDLLQERNLDAGLVIKNPIVQLVRFHANLTGI